MEKTTLQAVDVRWWAIKPAEVKKEEEDFMLLRYPISMDKYNKVETCILYYWEASICFRYGKDMKKAAGSMKKILRVIQNYLRVEESAKGSDRTNNPEDRNRIIQSKVRIGSSSPAGCGSV